MKRPPSACGTVILVAGDFPKRGGRAWRILAAAKRVIACDSLVDLEVEGAEILSVDNGDATDLESFVHPEHPMFRGSLMLVLRPTSPKVSVTAKGPGIPAQTWTRR